jgi:hypothetical protein
MIPVYQATISPPDTESSIIDTRSFSLYEIVNNEYDLFPEMSNFVFLLTILMFLATLILVTYSFLLQFIGSKWRNQYSGIAIITSSMLLKRMFDITYNDVVLPFDRPINFWVGIKYEFSFTTGFFLLVLANVMALFACLYQPIDESMSAELYPTITKSLVE